MVKEITATNEDPSFTGPRPSPTLPDGGSYSVYSKVTINASPEAVLKALMDISHWGDWNRMVPSVAVVKAAAKQTDMTTWQQGETVEFSCLMDPASEAITKNKELAVQVGPLVTKASLGANSTGPARTVVRWVSQGLPSFMVKAEHVNWLDDNGDGTTTYQHWEVFSGYAVPAIKLMHGKNLHQHFIHWAEDLKTYVEKASTD